MWDAYSMHRRSSMLSVLVVVPAIGRFFVNHGALLNIQHVLVEVQFCLSQRGSSGEYSAITATTPSRVYITFTKVIIANKWRRDY